MIPLLFKYLLKYRSPNEAALNTSLMPSSAKSAAKAFRSFDEPVKSKKSLSEETYISFAFSDLDNRDLTSVKESTSPCPEAIPFGFTKHTSITNTEIAITMVRFRSSDSKNLILTAVTG